MKSIVKIILKLVPANTLAAIIAEYVTKALSNIKDKEKLAKISEATCATSQAVDITAKAVADAKVTEEEVNQVSDGIQVAITKIIEAAR